MVTPWKVYVYVYANNEKTNFAPFGIHVTHSNVCDTVDEVVCNEQQWVEEFYGKKQKYCICIYDDSDTLVRSEVSAGF